MKRCPVEAVGVKCSFWCTVWPLEWDGVEYKGVLSKRDRSEFKPVGFNQTSVWVLGEKLYIWKRQQFGLAGENCALEYMACCYHCKGTAPEYRGFPHCVPFPAKSLGIAWMQWEQYSCGSKGCFITSQTPNSSPVYALRDILRGCVGYVKISRDHSKKLEKAFHTGLQIPGKVWLNFKGWWKFF